MSDFNRVLVLGTGPVGIQMALLFKKYLNSYIAIAGRESVRSAFIFTAMKESNQEIEVTIQNENHRRLEGRCKIDQAFHGYAAVQGEWDTLLLAVTTDSYIEVLSQLNVQLLRKVRCLLLISPTFGSNIVVKQYMKEIHSSPEVISFSTYLGDTRWHQGKPSNRVKTTGVKKKLYAGSSSLPSANVDKLHELYSHVGITLEVMRSPIEAESRNISLYVHPPLFMNEFSLKVVFHEVDSKKFVYKLFPEGPITPQLIRDMRRYWQEISSLLEKMKLQRLNLLKFMTNDNYPVRTESISRQDLADFIHLDSIHQEYLLYVRYASLLIDPFSEPDHEGKYFDFSAVPINTMFVNKDGYWEIPRMPKEDYYRIKIIQGIARFADSETPTLDRFIDTYERKLEETVLRLDGQPLSQAFTVQSFDEDLQRISSEFNDQEGIKC
ncbi:opine metallophore biosynthesis dehydrogenase [Cohnella panacarvi]|uniref:opine metallophore biosynthesis dehydrogenase n=1 Tax=Cohnella panacarvi TaxID=400776 RepID=UPI001B7FADBB|nr:opine metallophore biosynthesis dehydrogenase [Cohnella panacarvi]